MYTSTAQFWAFSHRRSSWMPDLHLKGWLWGGAACQILWWLSVITGWSGVRGNSIAGSIWRDFMNHLANREKEHWVPCIALRDDIRPTPQESRLNIQFSTLWYTSRENTHLLRRLRLGFTLPGVNLLVTEMVAWNLTHDSVPLFGEISEIDSLTFCRSPQVIDNGIFRCIPQPG